MEKQIQAAPFVQTFACKKEEETLMDKQRVAEAYAEYANTVTRAAWQYTGDIQTAQDCAEEAFLKLMTQEKMTDEHIAPWLIRTAVNIAKNVAKSHARSRTQPLDELDERASGDEQVLAQRAAARAMLSLPDKYKLPLMLHLAEGRTIAETAKLIGKSFNTTASLIRRGRKLLQKAFEKEEL